MNIKVKMVQVWLFMEWMSVLVSDSMMASLIWFPLLLIPVHVSSVTSADWIQVLLPVSVSLSVCGPARFKRCVYAHYSAGIPAGTC